MRNLLEKYLLISLPREGEGASGGTSGPAPAGGTPGATSSPSSESATNPAGAADPGSAGTTAAAAGASGAVATPSPDVPLPGQGTVAGQTGGAAPAKPEPKKESAPAWAKSRINKLTAQLKDAQEQLATVKPQGQAPASPPAPAPAPGLNPTAEFDRLVSERAAQMVNTNDFNRRCNDAAKKGRESWQDFDARLADVRSLVNPADAGEVEQYQSLLRAGLATGELHTIMYELGQDLDEAARVLALSPVEMGVELTKKVLAGQRIEPISALPKPLTPLAGGRGDQIQIDPTNPELADNLTTAEWMRRREAQLADRKSR